MRSRIFAVGAIAMQFVFLQFSFAQNTNFPSASGNAGLNNTSIGLNANDVVTGSDNTYLRWK